MTAEASKHASRPDIVRALRAAAFTGLVAFGLLLPLIAFRAIHDIRNELVLETRWPLFAAFVASAFVGQLIWQLLPRDRLKKMLAEFSRSPRKLAAAASTCALAAIILWIVGTAGFGAEAEIAFGLSYLFAFATIAFLIGAAAAWVTTRYPTSSAPGRERRHQIGIGLRMAGLGFLIAYPLMMLWLAGSQGSIKWIDNFGIQILIYVMLGWGLNIVVGLAGLLDLGYVAFYAVGAYSFALLAKNGLPFIAFASEYPYLAVDFYQLGPWAFWVLLPIAGILAAFWGILLGFPVLRLRGDYLAIVTLAFGEIIRLVLINWVDLTNGYAGISGVPRPSFFGIPFIEGEGGFAARYGLKFEAIHRTIFLYYVILVLALITALVTIRLRRLPIGRAWEALRENEIACRALGINTTTTKLTAFAIGAMFGGFAGSFFAARQGFISPESFTFMESAVIVAIVVLGGMGSQIGVAIAAIIMIGGTELMRELDVLKVIFGKGFDPTQYRMLLFGLGMVLIMIWKPRGLISKRQPSVFLKERKAVSSAHVREGHG
ncbi:MAG: high-affinity branched-chain amino acid ABC transporter permease LivM [Rhizobiales bacterium]|nr:high-affinity branched-chain amino acid ABC transporter permease LivM [Hyphomicrobiales bacterium]